MKKSKCLLLVICLMISIIFINCKSTEVADSADVNQDKIYQSYNVTYNEEENTITTKAVFRFGGTNGTTLILSDPSNIIINGEEMKGGEEFLQGYLYRENNFKKKYTEFEFIFTDTENKKYKNSLKIELIEFVDLPDTIRKSQTNIIAWKGAPIQSNETVMLLIKTGETSDITISSDIKGANSISIDTASISNLSTGLANIQIVRKISKVLSESGDIGGVISGNYYSIVKPIYVVE